MKFSFFSNLVYLNLAVVSEDRQQSQSSHEMKLVPAGPDKLL